MSLMDKKEGGGTVIIKTVEKDEVYQIVVTDDGVGFEPNEKSSDGILHIGIDNVKSRLQTIMNADIKVASGKGKSTTVIVNIPK